MDVLENVDCPMMCNNIDFAYCVELQMFVNDEVLPTDEEKHLSESDYEKCRHCKIRKMLEEE